MKLFNIFLVSIKTPGGYKYITLLNNNIEYNTIF